MEKNMVVVYDNGIGLPFLLKPMGKQVLLLSPGIELSRLRIDNINWDVDAVGDTKGGESEFSYLCMTGEEISSKRMFALMMLNLNMGNANTIKNLMETLALWGISCSYKPVNFDIYLSKRDKSGRLDFGYFGDGFFNSGMANVGCSAHNLGSSLVEAIRANAFPEINVTITNLDLDEEEYNFTRQKIMSIVRPETDIHLTFKDKED